MRPYGQHFLHDNNILDKIIALSGVDSSSHVLEIGPGEGVLTNRLLDVGCQVVAVEIDESLWGGLESRFGALPNFELIKGDALASKHGLSEELVSRLRKFSNYHLVSNLPYGAGTPLLLNLWQNDMRPLRGLVMLQKEVGERLVARSGDAAYGALSVMMANVSKCELVASVSRTSFRPPPNVDSCLVRIESIEPKINCELLRKVVTDGFAQRRKQLKRLEKVGFDFKSASIDPTLRAEQVTVDQWFELAQYVKTS